MPRSRYGSNTRSIWTCAIKSKSGLMKSGCPAAVAKATTLHIGFKQKTMYLPSSKKNPNQTLWATTDIKLAFHAQRGEYTITTKQLVWRGFLLLRSRVL